MAVATGLATLDNQDHVFYPVEQDGLVLSAAKDALQGTGYRCLAQLDCEVSGGVVQLRGELPSFFLKQVAQETVRQVKGFRGVRNLTVVR
jgi:osmotically-inducible protein OsmY